MSDSLFRWRAIWYTRKHINSVLLQWVQCSITGP